MAAWEEQLIIESYCRGKCMASRSPNAACSWFRLLSLLFTATVLIRSPVLKAKSTINHKLTEIHRQDSTHHSNDFTELTYGSIDPSKSKQHQLQAVPGITCSHFHWKWWFAGKHGHSKESNQLLWKRRSCRSLWFDFVLQWLCVWCAKNTS